MPRFTRAELESFRDADVPDLLGPDLRLLFVGINPGLWTAATQTHFAHPVNRFYPALLKAGIIDRADRPGGRAWTDDDRDHLRSRGIGITNLVRRATARADELTPTSCARAAGALARAGRARPAAGRRGRRHHGVPHARSDRRRRCSAASPSDLGGARAVGGAEPERPERARDRRHPRRRRTPSRRAPPGSFPPRLGGLLRAGRLVRAGRRTSPATPPGSRPARPWCTRTRWCARRLVSHS